MTSPSSLPMLVGIDYSMTSPAVCIFKGDPKKFNIAQCTFHFIAQNQKQIGKFAKGKFIGTELPEYLHDTERFSNIADWVLTTALSSGPLKATIIMLEDYAMGAKGRVFGIAENTGHLKQCLWRAGQPFATIAPTRLKKFATGKGNAQKPVLEAQFLSETGINIRDVLDMSEKSANPISDIIDAYYLTKYAAAQNVIEGVTGPLDGMVSISNSSEVSNQSTRRTAVSVGKASRTSPIEKEQILGAAIENPKLVARNPKMKRVLLKRIRAIIGKANWKLWLSTPSKCFDGHSPQELMDKGKFGFLIDLLKSGEVTPADE